QLILSLESPTSRMYRLASTAVYGEQYRSLDEVLRTVEALTADEVSGFAEEFFAPERQTVVSLGPNGGKPSSSVCPRKSRLRSIAWRSCRPAPSRSPATRTQSWWSRGQV